ncbi:major capsid protein [uncultured Gemmiger sp.]|uniref:major capsid protein n=1 Tax=uncultured Gemmiger sp. TaxID=1623490 RepID=UPI00266E94D3|nr:major capsid protein [uncultured Gemmiger sp.]
MPNMVDLYTPRTLAEVVKTTPPVRTFLRDRFFTNVKTFPTKRVDIDIVKGNRKMAAFIHPMVGGEIVQAEGYETKSYAPPLINPATISTADQLLERLPGEDMYSGKTPADRAAEKLIEEYNQLNDMTTRREEWMAAQVLTTGQLKVKGKGVDEVIDFGLTNKITLTSTKKWGASAADIWGNLKDWKQQVSRNGFANANMVIMGKAAADAFMADATVAKLLDNRRIEIGAIKPEEMEGGLTYYGHLNLPGVDIYGYDEVYLDDETGETKPLIPDNVVLMIPSAASFMRAYGLCTYLDDAGAWHRAETDRLLRTYVEHRPDRRFIELQTHPLLIPDKIDSWFAATVL